MFISHGPSLTLEMGLWGDILSHLLSDKDRVPGIKELHFQPGRQPLLPLVLQSVRPHRAGLSCSVDRLVAGFQFRGLTLAETFHEISVRQCVYV